MGSKKNIIFTLDADLVEVNFYNSGFFKLTLSISEYLITAGAQRGMHIKFILEY